MRSLISLVMCGITCTVSPRYVAAALLREHRLVDRAGRGVRLAGERHVDEALVVTEVEVGLAAVVGDEHLAVLEGVHRAGVDVDVGVELLHRDPQAPGLQEPPERRRREPLPEARGHTTGHEDVLGQDDLLIAWRDTASKIRARKRPCPTTPGTGSARHFGGSLRYPRYGAWIRCRDASCTFAGVATSPSTVRSPGRHVGAAAGASMRRSSRSPRRDPAPGVLPNVARRRRRRVRRRPGPCATVPSPSARCSRHRVRCTCRWCTCSIFSAGARSTHRARLVGRGGVCDRRGVRVRVSVTSRGIGVDGGGARHHHRLDPLDHGPTHRRRPATRCSSVLAMRSCGATRRAAVRSSPVRVAMGAASVKVLSVAALVIRSPVPGEPAVRAACGPRHRRAARRRRDRRFDAALGRRRVWTSRSRTTRGASTRDHPPAVQQARHHPLGPRPRTGRPRLGRCRVGRPPRRAAPGRPAG